MRSRILGGISQIASTGGARQQFPGKGRACDRALLQVGPPAVENLTRTDGGSMRRTVRKLTGAVLLVVGIATVARPAAAAPPTTDPDKAADIAATWLAHQVNDQGFIALPGSPGTANLSSTAQAVLAFAA